MGSPQNSSSGFTAKGDVLRIVNPGQVEMKGFLGGRMDANRRNRLGTYITEEWLLEGFRKRPGPHPWSGEHVGKWLHAAILASESKPSDTALSEKIERIANGLMDCQAEDGYLGTYSEQDRWGTTDLPFTSWETWPVWDVWVHKYDLIGLLSYYQATSDTKALDSCKRIGDLLIEVFGEGKCDILKSGAHEGMAATSILEPVSLLYQFTGEKKYLTFCEYVIQRADAGSKLMTNLENTRSVQNVGNKKAYEMMSNYLGLIEHWRATGYERGLEAAVLAWESIARENLFITGAPDAHELFSEPGTLVPTGMCTETCVQVTWIQMNWQLLRVTGDPRYGAMLHHHYYNHMLAAQNPDGTQWGYFTPMAGKKYHDGRKHCCGSSGPRAISLIPQAAYMTAEDTLAVNLYESSTFKGDINGAGISVEQNTDYPWNGDVSMTIETDSPVRFDLQLLIPDFVQSGHIQAADQEITTLDPGTYQRISRQWSGRTDVNIRFDMPAVLHTRDYEGRERHAVSRGPIVLALEEIKADNTQPHEVIPETDALDNAFSSGWTKSGVAHAVLLKGRKLTSGGDDPSGDVDLVYKPYCEAGSNGEIVNIWLPAVEP